MSVRELHEALLNPSNYPETTESISFRETHISRLYFTDNHVYKIKKPVDFGFLDFTTLEKRAFFCHEEVRLNRRFAPDTYLDVLKIIRQNHRIVVGGDGPPIEYAVLMRRLPEERMLSCLLERDDPSLQEEILRVARRIAELHESSARQREDKGENLDTVRANWIENYTQMKPFVPELFPPSLLTLCSAYTDRFLEKNGRLMRLREEKGNVRDTHGDLHVEHVCLTDPIRIYDCIEFNRRFRIADVAADLAFLLMDLDLRGRRDLSETLLGEYLRVSGEKEDFEILLPFYKIYRAFVRGKVNTLLAKENPSDSRLHIEAVEKARRYFGLAIGYLLPPVLLLTCGLMGVGKTAVARQLAEATGGRLLRSDLIRKELAGVPSRTKSLDHFGEGLYSPSLNRQTYAFLLERSLKALSEGKQVIADASFMRKSDRDLFFQAAKEKHLPVFLLHMTCDRGTVLSRLSERQRADSDISDGRVELYPQQEASFEKPTAEEAPIRVDTRLDVNYNVISILCGILERLGTYP